MAEIINLRRARKAKARAGSEADAAANRAKSGMKRIDREQAEVERGRAARKLDGHKLTLPEQH